MPNATFGISSTGAIIILDEGFTGTPPLRVLYMTFGTLFCIFITAKVLQCYLALSSQQSKKGKTPGNCLNLSLLVCFIASHVIHSMHIVDHMFRPVYYHEPDWAYKKYLVTEVEAGNYTTLVTSLVGLFGIRRILLGVHTQNGRLVRSTILPLVFYILFGCVFGFVHYLAEKPSNYGAMAHFTISGPGIVCIPFAISILYAVCTISTVSVSNKSGVKGESKVPLLEDEDGESTRVPRSSERVSDPGHTARRRSKTPVKK